MSIHSCCRWIPTVCEALANKHVACIIWIHTTLYGRRERQLRLIRLKGVGWRAPVVSGSARISTKASRPSPGIHVQHGSWLHCLLCIHIPSSCGVSSITCRSSKINPIVWYSLMSFSSPSCSVPPINSTLVPRPHSGPVFLLNESSQWH